ncbi:programmed cell death protein 1 [Pyxicephalus adspersus]|uniref:programmed cell death protein 1 n=1 Tax=Pyxicephalus adspersus TaxID=30357 RepID=UPI003B5BABDA
MTKHKNIGGLDDGKMLLSHSPVHLNVSLGETAIFTCNLTALNFTPKDINWYKKANSTNSKKIADVKYADNDRFHITTDWAQKKAMLYIRNVMLNDSGQYHCGHVNVEKNGLIFTSNISDLTVENITYITTTETDQTTKDPSTKSSFKNGIIATSILLPLLLIVTATFLVWYKQRDKMLQPQLRHLEKPPQDSDVYTVDYGVLDFGNNQPFRISAENSVQEQVEYATIMFP